MFWLLNSKILSNPLIIWLYHVIPQQKMIDHIFDEIYRSKYYLILSFSLGWNLIVFQDHLPSLCSKSHPWLAFLSTAGDHGQQEPWRSIYIMWLWLQKNMLIWFRNHAKWWCHLTYRIPLATVLRWFWLQWNSNKPWEAAWDTVQFSIFVHVISTRDRYWNHISYYNKDWPVTWAFKKPGQCCMSNQAPPTRSQLPIPFPSIYEVLVCKFLPFVDLCNVWWPL